MITAAYVKRMFDMNNIFSFVFISSVSLLLGCSCFGAVDCSAVSLTLSVQTDPMFFNVSVVVMDTAAS